MERLRSPRIQDGRHQLEVMRYGDLNPVRAGLVATAGHWKWSSFRHYAHGERDDLLTDAPEYLALGRNAPERRRAYLHLFAKRSSSRALRRGYHLGDDSPRNVRPLAVRLTSRASAFTRRALPAPDGCGAR